LEELKWLLECYANAKEPVAHKGESPIVDEKFKSWAEIFCKTRFSVKLAIRAIRDSD
jgi:hypothetical protein